jgi:hypothetical protein
MRVQWTMEWTSNYSLYSSLINFIFRISSVHMSATFAIEWWHQEKQVLSNLWYSCTDRFSPLLDWCVHGDKMNYALRILVAISNMMTIYYPPRSYNFCMFPLCRLTSPLEDKMPSIAQFINGVLVYCISFPIFSPIQNVRSKFSWNANVTKWKSVLSLYTSVLRNAILIFVACGDSGSVRKDNSISILEEFFGNTRSKRGGNVHTYIEVWQLILVFLCAMPHVDLCYLCIYELGTHFIILLSRIISQNDSIIKFLCAYVSFLKRAHIYWYTTSL